jgi:mRNA capping enzyme/mRNA capping enzyme, catalytic domain/mRNA capping enzyme, C-terminal domain
MDDESNIDVGIQFDKDFDPEALEIREAEEAQKQIEQVMLLEEEEEKVLKKDVSQKLKELYAKLNPKKHGFKQVLEKKLDVYTEKVSEEFEPRGAEEETVTLGIGFDGKEKVLKTGKGRPRNFVTIPFVKEEREVIKEARNILFERVRQTILTEMNLLPTQPLVEEPVKQEYKISEIFTKDIDILAKNISLPNIEFEVSFGYFYTGKDNNLNFRPFLSSFGFSIVKDYFNNKLDQFTRINTFDIVKIDGDVREITTGKKVVYEQKKRNITIDDRMWGVRASISTEKQLKEKPKNWSPTFTRGRQRFSFECMNENSVFFGTRIDLSIITVFKQEKQSFENFFELEIEKVGQTTLNKFISAVKQLVAITQNTEDINLILTSKEKTSIINQHNRLFDVFNFKKLFEYKLNPINIQNRFILGRTTKYFPTIKFDGLRSYLFITTHGIYLIFHPTDIIKISVVGSKKFDNTLLDGEFVSRQTENSLTKTFFAFDILFLSGEDIRKMQFQDRYSKLLFVVKQVESISGTPQTNIYREEKLPLQFPKDLVAAQQEEIKTESSKIAYKRRPQKHSTVSKPEPVKTGSKEYIVQAKKYFIDVDFFSSCDLAIKEYQKISKDDNDTPTDGLVFQPDAPYNKEASIWKWKPVSKLTIDFLVKKTKDANQFELFVIDQNDQLVPFMGNKDKPFSSFIKASDTYDDIKIDNFVVECFYQNYTFHITRIRYDKDKPNYTTVAQNVWKDIHRNFLLDTISGKNTVLFRMYHNSIKNSLITSQSVKNGVVVDVGSGRGGDLLKWRESGLSKIFAVEPNQEFLQEFKKRYSTVFNKVQTPKIQLLEQEFETVEIPDQKINTIFFFFSLTFFSESEEKYKSLLEKINQLSSSKTKIVGTVLDGKLLKNQLGNLDSITSSCFDITKIEFGDSDFGNKIHFKLKDDESMVDYDEYLFYTDRFFKDLENMNFTRKKVGIIKSNSDGKVSEYENINSCEKTLTEMYKYFVFQKK